MNKNKITIIAIVTVFSFINFVFAVEVKSFRMTTNNTSISSGDIILVSAQLETNGAVNVDIPQFPQNDDYTVLSSNKSQSSSTSISMVNGRTTTERTVTTRFTYQILFNSQKTASLPPLSVNIDNKQISTNPITFNIGEKREESSPVSVRFMRERNTIYKGEQARLTVRVMVRANANAQLTNDGYSGFINTFQERLARDFTLTPLARSPETKTDVINGIPYQIYDLPFNLVPLDTGKMTVGQIPIVYIVQERGSGRDPFDGFFGFSSIRQRQASSNSPTLTYTINELPRPIPRNFRGVIGEVKVSGTISNDSTKAGDATTLRITMSGKMPSALMGEIELEKNPDLDIFPPERRVTQDTSSNGITTRKQYSWMIVPRKEGTFNIPIREIVWFDPNSATYKTTPAISFTINASPGNYSQQIQTTKRYLTQNEIATLGDDIRYIKTIFSTNDINKNPINKNLLLWLFLAAWILSLILILLKIKTVFFPKNINEEKKSKAFSSAVRELNRIVSGKESFSPMATIIKYLSAKTSKEVGSMKYNEIEDMLADRKVGEKNRQNLTKYFREVEMARYSSGIAQNNLAQNGIELLKNIEKEFK